MMNNGSRGNSKDIFIEKKQSSPLKTDNSFEQKQQDLNSLSKFLVNEKKTKNIFPQKQQNINNTPLAQLQNKEKNFSKKSSANLKGISSYLKQVNLSNPKINNYQPRRKDLSKLLPNPIDYSFCDNLKKSAKGEPCISKYIKGKYYLFLASSMVRIRELVTENEVGTTR